MGQGANPLQAFQSNLSGIGNTFSDAFGNISSGVSALMGGGGGPTGSSGDGSSGNVQSTIPIGGGPGNQMDPAGYTNLNPNQPPDPTQNVGGQQSLPSDPAGQTQTGQEFTQWLQQQMQQQTQQPARPTSTGRMPQPDVQQPARPVTPTPQPNVPIGGGPGNVQQAPTGTPAAATTGAPPEQDPGIGYKDPNADKPAAGAAPAIATAPDGGQGGYGQQGGDGAQFMQGLISMFLPMLLGGLMGGGGGGMAAMLPLMMMMGMGMGGRGMGHMFGGRRMIPGFGGGFLHRGYYPDGRGGFGFHPGGMHPGWQPHYMGAYNPRAGRDWAANRYGGGAVAPQGPYTSDHVGGDVPPGTGPGSSSTRADRNLNPGNIMWGPWAQQHGATQGVGNDQGHLVAVFPSAAAGWNAMGSLLRAKYGSGMRSINQLIATPGQGWTPGNYQAAANIARMIGIDPNADINLNDPAMLSRLMRAMAIQEGAPNLVRAFGGQARPSTQTATAPATPETPSSPSMAYLNPDASRGQGFDVATAQ